MLDRRIICRSVIRGLEVYALWEVSVGEKQSIRVYDSMSDLIYNNRGKDFPRNYLTQQKESLKLQIGEDGEEIPLLPLNEDDITMLTLSVADSFTERELANELEESLLIGSVS